MKKLFTAIGFLLIVLGLKAQVPAKKETTKAPVNQTEKSKFVKPKAVRKEDTKAMPKVENKARPKVEKKAMPKVENKAMPKVENKAVPNRK